MGCRLRNVACRSARRVKPATVRFYFDADILGLAKVVGALRPDVTYPGDPGAQMHGFARAPCAVTTTDTPDTAWIPYTAADGMIAITRDGRISRRVAELAAVVHHSARLVVLTSADAGTDWGQLEVLMTQWRRIERLYEVPGPLIYRASRSSLQAVELS